jgi:hypothetical protein
VEKHDPVLAGLPSWLTALPPGEWAVALMTAAAKGGARAGHIVDGGRYPQVPPVTTGEGAAVLAQLTAATLSSVMVDALETSGDGVALIAAERRHPTGLPAPGGDPVQALAVAGALIAAEIDRIQAGQHA